MATDVIVLNGGSSSGKSSIARRLQELLEEPWVRLGVDDLVDALDPSLVGAAPERPGRAPLVRYGARGEVLLDPAWKPVESAWYRGIAAMAGAGLHVIVDEILLAGGAGQRELAVLLQGLEVVWVGVKCEPAVAAAREVSRSDRLGGMAVSQAAVVHEGVRYDVVVDTTARSVEECAREVLVRVEQRPGGSRGSHRAKA